MGFGDIKRCDNHIDYFATTGVLREIFDHILYGYYYHKNQEGIPDRIKFSLFFSDPFDPVLEKHGDLNGFCKKEVEGFSEAPPYELSDEIKGIQINPLQYNGYSPNKPEAEPTIEDALTNNIYFDNRNFFKRFKNKNPAQIKEFKDNSILYKVTMDVPFSAIAQYITVDKSLIQKGVEQTKNIYSPETKDNPVEELFKTMEKAESLVNEMSRLIGYINSHPETYKQPIKSGQSSEFNDEMRKKYSSENAGVMIQKVSSDFKQMRDVIFQMRYFDIKAEIEDLDKPKKCAHDKCNNFAEKGSDYCSQCIQLPTMECNFCNTVIK